MKEETSPLAQADPGELYRRIRALCVAFPQIQLRWLPNCNALLAAKAVKETSELKSFYLQLQAEGVQVELDTEEGMTFLVVKQPAAPLKE